MSHRVVAASAFAALASAAAIALPALGDTGPGLLAPAPDAMRAQDPAEPIPAPGETNIPPAGDAAEDDRPTSTAQRDHVLDQLRAVAACVRGTGQMVPEPVADSEGVRLAWDGPPDRALEAAIRHCDPALN